MKKTEMIVKIAQENGLSRKAAQNTYDSIINSFTEGIAAHGQFVLPGIGTFEIIKTVEDSALGSCIKYRPAKTLREALGK